MLTVAAIAEYLQQLAPSRLAADWDNVGLLLGERSAGVERVMTCLTLTPESAGEAIAERAGLVVSHHPILFRGIKRLTDATPEGAMLLSLVRAGVAVYSAHTAFDGCPGGINEILSDRLGLTQVQPLRTALDAQQHKLVVFVPEKDLERVSAAIFAAGAGHIGEYRECSFRLSGIGTFFGSEAANPTIGQKGRREEVAEWRLEAICPELRLDTIVAAMRKAHSYEEPAYDIYPLQRRKTSSGEGRLGMLEQPRPLMEVAGRIKEQLRAGLVQVVGERDHPVQRVAIACGAGGEFLSDAIRARADVLLTGEARFHDYLRARAEGIALILPGHHASERLGVEVLAERLQKTWPELKVWASRQESDPVTWT